MLKIEHSNYNNSFDNQKVMWYVGGSFGTSWLYNTAKGAVNTLAGGKPLWKGNPIGNFVGVANAQTAPSNAPATNIYGAGYDSKGNLLNNAQGQAIRNANPPSNTGSVSNPIPTNNPPIQNQGQNQNQGYQNIQQAQDNGNAQIEADYNSSMNQLAGAEQGLQGQAATATGQITNEAAKTGTQLGAQQATQQQGVQSSLSTAEIQGTSAMQQARDLFRQTQQQNNAQLSALGISSSSVAEALAERLGVETARRIAGVTGSIQEVRQNATNELGRIKNYYAEKTTQLQDWVANQKSVIQNSLLQGLNQINSARSQAASDKSSSRANLLQQVQSSIYNLTAQQQQFDQSLQAWATQKSAALQPIVQDPNYVNNLISTAQNLNKQFQPTGFSFTPQVNYDKFGNISGQVSSNKNPTDQFGNPIQQQPTGQITPNNGVGQPDFNKYPNDGFTF